MLHLIESWEEINENFQNFNSSLATSQSTALDRLSQFYHWYYLPSLKCFAPSKFLGYRGMTLITYEGDGNGGETQRALHKYFHKLDRGTSEYKDLLNKLSLFLQSMGKNLSVKTIQGPGGIYIPKKEFETGLLNNHALLNQVTKDLESQHSENEDPSTEGGKKTRLVSYYERNPALRTKAIELHGLTCQVCGFNFLKSYGKHGDNYIEVHHLIPLSASNSKVIVNPQTEMAVLCANCHRMIHRDRDNILSIDDLRKKMQ